MYPEIKALWLAELRSGNWLQGTEELKVDRGETPRYCCLGVLCELATREGKTDAWEWTGPHNTYRLYGDNEDFDGDGFDPKWSWSKLPQNVRDWSGIDNYDPLVVVSPEHEKYARLKALDYLDNISNTVCISALNDDGWTFDEIADLIEEQL